MALLSAGMRIILLLRMTRLVIHGDGAWPHCATGCGYGEGEARPSLLPRCFVCNVPSGTRLPPSDARLRIVSAGFSATRDPRDPARLLSFLRNAEDGLQTFSRHGSWG